MISRNSRMMKTVLRLFRAIALYICGTSSGLRTLDAAVA